MREDMLITKLPRLTRAVALSNRSKLARYTDDDIRALRDSAEYWRDVVNYVAEQKQSIEGRYIQVRYEDICSDVHGVLKSILSDLNVSLGKFDMGDIPKELTVTNEKHFEECSKEEKMVLNDILANSLRRYNYDQFRL